MRQQSDVILTDAVTTDDQFSEVVDLRQSFAWAVQYSFVGGVPSVSLVVQGSNDSVVWSQISATAISAAGSGVLNMPDIGYAYGRVFSDWTSGASALTVTASKKGM